ncbi:MAG TPA: hypothetical protein VN802_07410 [Stellaceae bacterium]|nr:hypothetical protein [Stellaceae bacterium]
MAAPGTAIEAYESWLREYVRLAEAGRKLATQLGDASRRRGERLNEQRFSGHAHRLYNEEVYWTLQIAGVTSLAAAEREAAPAAPRAKKAAKKAKAR